MDLLDKLLTPSVPEVLATLPQWEECHRKAVAQAKAPIEQAFMTGMAVDRLGYAFASGQQIALSSVLGGQMGVLSAMCITEDEGGDASDLQAYIEGGRLFGKKTFVMLGPVAKMLWVVARETKNSGDLGRLVLLRVRVPNANLEIRRLKSMEFLPEIPHADIFFEGVDLMGEEILPGDGFEHYVKPFRTAEDLYVHAAFLGWYSQVLARAEAPATLQEELLVYVQALRALAMQPLTSATLQLGLSGAMRKIHALLETPGAFWDDVDVLTRERFERDLPILATASRNQNRRREAAWQKFHNASRK